MNSLKPLPGWAYAFFMLNCFVFFGLLTLISIGVWWPVLVDVAIVAVVGGTLSAKGYDMGGAEG